VKKKCHASGRVGRCDPHVAGDLGWCKRNASGRLGLQLLAIALAIASYLISNPVRAECGGSVECIAVSIDTSVAPSHGTPETSAPIDFGSQSAATASASRTVLVAAVTGPAGTRATLNSITLSGANASDFLITGGTCTTGTPTLLHDGNATAQIANACTITVAFRPAAVGVKNAQLSVATAAITRNVPLTGTGTPSLTGPSAGAATLTVQVNSSASLDLAPFITGTVTGVAIVSAPAHGTATASGTTVTYTPRADYFGPDSFTYAAFNAVGSSAPATVSVTVGGRPDPSKNANVIGLLSAQARAARRFSRAQISNFHRRMESLHRGAEAPDGAAMGVQDGLAVHPSNPLSLRPGRTAEDMLRPGRTAEDVLRSGRTEQDPFVLSPSTALRTGVSKHERPFGVAQDRPFGVAQDRPFDFAGAPLRANGDRLGSMVAGLMNAASSQSLNLSYGANGGSGTNGASGSSAEGATGLWVGGNLHFGTRDPNNDGSSMRFRTDGVSIGLDHRFTDRLTLGIGVGYAHDRTDIGTDGTQNRARGGSIALYGSFQPTRNTFIDGLVGYGDLKHDMDRYVAAVDDFARATRKSDQIFASIAAGYEFHRDGVLLSPYGRIDYALDRLKQATETGAGLNALTYFDQDVRTLQFALGLRAESRHATNFGWALPRVRLELKHDFEGEDAAAIAYADQFSGPRYSVLPTGMKRNALLLGVGSDFILRSGLRLGVDYQLQTSFGPDRSHAVRLWLAKELDGKGGIAMPGYASAKLFGDPVRVEAGVMWDDNLTRAREPPDKLSDHIYLLGASKTTFIEITDYTRFMLRGFLDGEKPYRYDRLDRIAGGVHGELQHRTSEHFGAPTFGVFVRGLMEEYGSELRGGYRYSFGVNARQSMTDRIDLFGALARNMRDAEHTVFDTHDYSARLNLDWSLGSRGTIYLGGEYRHGDTVSTGPFSLQSVDIAEAFTPDDGFRRGDLFAYRFKANTWISTLGYNLPLGPRDSIDFSWRRAESKPTSSGTGLYGSVGNARYIANQISLVYLMRF